MSPLSGFRVVVRCDAGEQIGLGHLMRCRTLASAIVAGGGEVRFASRRDLAFERTCGVSPDLLLPGLPSFDELPRDDAEAVGRFARGADWVVVDHYGATADWLQVVRELAPGVRILLFEDHQQRSGADLRLAPLQEPAAQTLSGLEYLLLRPPFRGARRGAPAVDRCGWVIAFGGTDPERLAAKAVTRLLARGGALPQLTVLSRDAQIDPLLADWPAAAQRIEWLDADPLATLLARSEAALLSCSGIAFEALAMGTPIVAAQWADNQVQHARCLEQAGFAVSRDVGRAADLLARGCAVHRPLCDGGGVGRVIDALLRETPGMAARASRSAAQRPRTQSPWAAR